VNLGHLEKYYFSFPDLPCF